MNALMHKREGEYYMNISNISLTDILTVFISFLALINSVAICILTKRNLTLVKQNVESTQENIKLTKQQLDLQREHNNKIVQPKCNIVSTEINSTIKISISNYGNGIMTIEDIIITNKETGLVCHSLFEIIPENINIYYYSVDTQGKDIAVKGHIKLIEILFENDTDKIQYNKVRKILSQYKVTVKYHCIYGNHFVAEKDLEILFGKIYRG